MKRRVIKIILFALLAILAIAIVAYSAVVIKKHIDKKQLAEAVKTTEKIVGQMRGVNSCVIAVTGHTAKVYVRLEKDGIISTEKIKNRVWNQRIKGIYFVEVITD